MSTPCSNNPDEVIAKVVSAKANADKFDKFVNGGAYESVQLGSGAATPTIRHTVRLMESAAAELDGTDVSGKYAVASNGGAESRTLSARFADIVNVKDFGALGDGDTDDSEAIAEAYETDASEIWFPEGVYISSTLPDMTKARGAGAVQVGDAVIPAGSIEEPLAIAFPGVFSSLHDIVDYLHSKTIHADVTVSIAAGTYILTQPIEIEHPDGGHISIIGAGKATTYLVFSLSSNASQGGIKVVGPYRIKKIDALTLDGNNLYGYTGGSPAESAGSSEDPIGVRAEDGANIVLGTDVAIKNFARNGIAAFTGSTVIARGVEVSGCGSDNFCASQCGCLFATNAISEACYGDGFYADGGGTIWANNSQALNNVGRANTNGHGFVATAGGTVFAKNAVSSGNAGSGFVATRNGYISAPSSVSQKNAVHGFSAAYGGNIFADGAVAGGDESRDGNSKNGFIAESGGIIGAVSAKSKYNGQHGVVAQVWGSVNFYGGLSSNNSNNGCHVTNGGVLSIDGMQGVVNNGLTGIECTTNGLVLATSVSVAAKVTGNGTAALGGAQVTGTGRDKSYIYIEN